MARPQKPGTQYGGGNSTSGGGSKLHGFLDGLLGGLAGGPTTSAAPTGTTMSTDIFTGDTSSSAPGQDPSGQLSPPVVTNAPYTVKHPILDAIFNQGRGSANANAANIGYQTNTAENANALNNQLMLAKEQQQYQTGRDTVLHSNEIDLAQKKNVLDQLAASHSANVQLLTGQGVLDNPANEASYDQDVSPTALQASAGGANNRFLQSRITGQQLSATEQAQSDNPDLMDDTATNMLNTQNLQSAGARSNTPLATAATGAQLAAVPAQTRTELNRSSLIPAQPLFNVNTKQATFPTGMQQYQNTMAQKLMSNGQGAAPNDLTPPASGGAIPLQNISTQVNPPTQGQPQPIQLPNGLFLDSTGTFRNKQGQVTDANGNITQ